MRENFPGAGEQSDSSVVLTVLATTFTFTTDYEKAFTWMSCVGLLT